MVLETWVCLTIRSSDCTDRSIALHPAQDMLAVSLTISDRWGLSACHMPRAKSHISPVFGRFYFKTQRAPCPDRKVGLAVDTKGLHATAVPRLVPQVVTIHRQ